MPDANGQATPEEIALLKARSGTSGSSPFTQNQPKLGGSSGGGGINDILKKLGLGGGGVRTGGVGGVGGGGGGTGPGGNLPNQVNSRYQGQRSPVMDEIQNRFRTNYARGEALYNDIPNFQGEEAKIRSNASVLAREAEQRAGAHGGLGLNPAQMADARRSTNEAVTQSARQWHDAAVGHQANMFGALNQASGLASGSELGQLANINQQIQLQQAANQQGFQAWLEQAKLPIAAMQAQNSGTASILAALAPYIQMMQKQQTGGTWGV
jgi:hypothetical protein